jgi:hypothetical protein
MALLAGLFQAPLKTFPPGSGPANATGTAKGKMIETAAQQVLGRQMSGCFGIGDDMSDIRKILIAMSHDHGGEAQSQNLSNMFAIAQEDTLGVQFSQARPDFVQAARLPMKSPRPVVPGVIGKTTQQGAARPAGRFQKQNHLWQLFHAQAHILAGTVIFSTF